MSSDLGASVFLVEDETLIRMLVADMLAELGHHVTAETGDLAEAMQLAVHAEFDLAILDVDLGGQAVAPVVKLIEERGSPFFLTTGYGAAQLTEHFPERHWLQKPFQIDHLARMINMVRAERPVQNGGSR